MKRHRLTRRAFIGSALSLPAIRTASADCSSPELRIRVRNDFKSFDPADAWGEDAIITRNILAPLVRYKKQGNSGNWGWERHLVRSISEGDARHYEFELRDEAWRHAGDISAEDAAFSFERIAGLNNTITDAKNNESWSALESVDTDGSSKATIVLNSDRPDLLTTVLPGVAGCVVSKSHVSQLSSGRFDLDPGPTSGRYELCDVIPDVEAKLTRDDSWRGDRAKIESAAFVVVEDDAAAQSMWLAGELDVYRPGVDVLKMSIAQDRPVYWTSTSRTNMLVLSQRGALENPQLRRAVQLAVNRTEIGRVALANDNPVIATGLVPRGWDGWTSEPLVTYNPDEAERLANANQQAGLRIGTWPTPEFIRMAEQVKSDLEKVGIRGDVNALERGPYWRALADDRVDILVTQTPSQTVGALTAFERFGSKSLGWYDNAEFDQLLEVSRSSLDSERLLVMQKMLVGDGIVVPLVEDQIAYLVAVNVRPAFDPDGSIGDLGSWERL